MATVRGWGTGKGSGRIGATRRSQPWARHRRRGTRGRRQRWSGPTAARICSGEKLCKQQSSNWEIRVWDGCSPRVQTQERLSDGGDAGRPRVDVSGASAARGGHL
jgi:hypothetical protein